MSFEEDPLLNELQSLKTRDEILNTALEKTKKALRNSEYPGVAKKTSEISLLLVDYEKASEALRKSDYFVDNCEAFLDKSMIIVNASFFFELECALRSFDLAHSLLFTPFIKDDVYMFNLVEAVNCSPSDYLHRIRKLAHSRGDEDIVDELYLLLMFFVSHELGHLVNNQDERQFTTMLRTDAKLEEKIANSVVKLCRHVDEFSKYGFGLPGWVEVETNSTEIRKKEASLRGQADVNWENVNLWFKGEITADNIGARVLTSHLRAIEKEDKRVADLHQYLITKALFAAAVYSWYKDLHMFSLKMGYDYMLNSRILMATLMENRSRYIEVASLFGYVHRFTLLRATLAIEQILKSRLNLPCTVESDKIWVEDEFSEKKSGTSGIENWWLAQSLQRYILLCILMDTAVKMAYVGCSTGWLIDADKRRNTPQLLSMNFESIGTAVERMKRITALNFKAKV